ncbi:MAG: TIM barrel protein [Thermomicrobiales bacterium]|nr:TIM barrel protein [Thermomicrobiales bacterium]
MATGPAPLRFAYSTINWGVTPDLASVAAEIREHGWGAVELFWHDLGWLGPPSLLRDTLGDLQVATLFGQVELPTDAGQMTRLRNEIAYAAELGAAHYGLIGGTRLRQRPPDTGEAASLASFCEELARYGETVGVKVAYHPHVACTVETEAEIDRLLDSTQALALCLDVSHIALVGEDPLAHWAKYRERTAYVHLKDWARGKFVEIGAGTLDIDFAGFLAALEGASFPGWVVVEQSRSDVSPRHSAGVNAAALRRLGYDPGAAG